MGAAVPNPLARSIAPCTSPGPMQVAPRMGLLRTMRAAHGSVTPEVAQRCNNAHLRSRKKSGRLEMRSRVGPVLTRPNIVNSGLRHAKASRQRRLRFLRKEYRNNLFMSETSSAVFCSYFYRRRTATFCVAVVRVVFVCSGKQMFGINTQRDVAMVASET